MSTPDDKHVSPTSKVGVTPGKQLEKKNIQIYVECGNHFV